jgi:hypothetical protein
MYTDPFLKSFDDIVPCRITSRLRPQLCGLAGLGDFTVDLESVLLTSIVAIE